MLIIYTKTGCPWCRGALERLRTLKIAFEERNVTESKAFFEEMVLKSKQSKAPTVDLDGTILGDASADEIEVFLRSNGVLS